MIRSQTAILLTIFCIGAGALKASDGPLSPKEAMASFKLEPGLKLELVASEPMVVDPVAIAFDERGRMYVAENRGYPTGPGKDQPPVGRIVLLEDTDSDGKYDKRTVYADGLTYPNGIQCWRGGIFVTCAPDILFFKDTDGDGNAAWTRLVFTGFQTQSTAQLRISHPTLGPDGWIYVTSGLTSSKVTSPDYPDRPPVQLNRTDFRFNPHTEALEPVPGTAQFGTSFDSFGRRFICSNRNHNQHVVLDPRYVQRNPYLALSEIVQDTPDHGAASRVYAASANITTAASHAGHFTSACGVTINTGTALPTGYWGSAFTCEPAGNLVHRDMLSPKGPTFTARRAHEKMEFLASTDNWFRPVNLAVGPEGALYICDMYRKTIEHPDYLPEETRKITDFDSGKDKGRIYRVISTAHRRFATLPANLNKLSQKELCLLLNSPEGWRRTTAHRLLLEKKDSKVVPMIKTVMTAGTTPEGRILAMRLLDSFGALDDAMIATALDDRRAPVREHAIQLAEPRLNTSPALSEKLINMAGDPDPRVRFLCALALGEINQPRIVPSLVRIAARDGADKWTRAAVLSSVGEHSGKMCEQFMSVVSGLFKTEPAEAPRLLPILADLGRVVGKDPRQSLTPLVQIATVSGAERDYSWQIALLSGLADGMRSRPTEKGQASKTLSDIAREVSETAERRVSNLLDRARDIANDAQLSLEQRMAAVDLLAHAGSEKTADTLLSLIDPQHPSELQIACIRALCQKGDPETANALLNAERWNAYTQPVKDAVLTAMIGKPALLDALLSAIERGDIAPLSVSPEKRNQLMKHKDEAIKQRALKLFKDLKPGDRMKAFEDAKASLSLKPNPSNGRRLFAQYCASCHVFAGTGHTVGPDLTGIRSQPEEAILLHIIVPEYEIMPTYTQYNVETRDGQAFSGLLAGETPSAITLRQAMSIEETIPRSNIASMRASTLSLMPQEMEKAMSSQELADLVGFLKGH